MSQSPIPPPIPRSPASREKKQHEKIIVWLSFTFVGMLAVAALVFVLMLENKTDKAERLVREAKAYLQEDNLLAAKVLLEEAVELYSKDAESLLENVTAKLQANQLAEDQQREKEKQRRIATRQLEEERRRKQLEKQEAERLAAEEELRRAKETEEARLRETIRKELELARKAEEDKKPKTVEPKSLPDLLQQVLSSVVLIDIGNAQASGFVVSPGMICTNHHVIEDATSAEINFNNGRKVKADGVLFQNESMDIAILKVDIPSGVSSLKLKPRDPRQGEKVYAIGHPMGNRNSVTDGIVSQVHSRSSNSNFKEFGLTGTWIQMTAAINVGNSGGPLINPKGEVVGVSAWKLKSMRDKKGDLSVTHGMFFASSASNIAKALRLARSSRPKEFAGDHVKIKNRKVGDGRPGGPKDFTATPSGLKYKVLRKGSGAKPKATDTVTVNYRGWLDNGKEFDSSSKRGEPISFPLNRVIPGWTEGMQLVGKGGMIELEIPSELGYGARGAGGAIPPNADLHFIVELIDIER